LYIFNFEFVLQLRISNFQNTLLFYYLFFSQFQGLDRYGLLHTDFFCHFGFSSNNLKLAKVHDMK